MTSITSRSPDWNELPSVCWQEIIHLSKYREWLVLSGVNKACNQEIERFAQRIQSVRSIEELALVLTRFIARIPENQVGHFTCSFSEYREPVHVVCVRQLSSLSKIKEFNSLTPFKRGYRTKSLHKTYLAQTCFLDTQPFLGRKWFKGNDYEPVVISEPNFAIYSDVLKHHYIYSVNSHGNQNKGFGACCALPVAGGYNPALPERALSHAVFHDFVLSVIAPHLSQWAKNRQVTKSERTFRTISDIAYFVLHRGQ